MTQVNLQRREPVKTMENLVNDAVKQENEAETARRAKEATVKASVTSSVKKLSQFMMLSSNAK